MKLGYCHRVGNRLVRPGELSPFGTHIVANVPKLFPDEWSAYLNIKDFDFELCKKLDALLIMVGAADLEILVDLIDKIPVKKIIHMDGGECDLNRWHWKDVLKVKTICSKSDLIICLDERSLSFWYCFVDKSILFWPMPYPVTEALQIIRAPYNDKIYDIVSPYGFGHAHGTLRNPLPALLACREVLNRYSVFRNAIFFDTFDLSYSEHLADFGLDSLEVSGLTDPKTFVQIIANSKIVISMDRHRASGRPAIETALSKVPGIFTHQCPNAYTVYKGIKLHDPFDVDAVLNSVKLVATNEWKDEWLEEAYNNALRFGFKEKAKILEDAL